MQTFDSGKTPTEDGTCSIAKFDTWHWPLVNSSNGYTVWRSIECQTSERRRAFVASRGIASSLIFLFESKSHPSARFVLYSPIFFVLSSYSRMPHRGKWTCKRNWANSKTIFNVFYFMIILYRNLFSYRFRTNVSSIFTRRNTSTAPTLTNGTNRQSIVTWRNRPFSISWTREHWPSDNINNRP